MVNMANVKPRFEVHARPDETKVETHYVRDTETGMNVPEEVEVPYGYDVYFPNGSSMRVRTTEELKRLGFAEGADLIDMESGESVGQPQTSLKQNVQRRASSKRRSDTASVDANQGE